jgi:hypothetical protein
LNPREIRQIGPYPVRRFIAEGGMAWVFEVTDPEVFDAPRALKMLKPGMGDDIFRRFKEEAGRLTRLDHPNLITIYKFGFDEATQCHYYTMTLVTGGTLSELGVLPLGEAGDIFLGALDGLAKLHENGIIHRDIKPSNILIDADGRPKIADLGIARTADVSEGATWVATVQRGGTVTGLAIGTPAYMSPEQARAQRGISKSTDVFSFGLTMYSVLTGHSVYADVPGLDSTSGQDIIAYLGHLSFSHSDFEFDFESEYPIAASVQEVIQRACAIDPQDRYADAAEMYEALRVALDEAQAEGPLPASAGGAESTRTMRRPLRQRTTTGMRAKTGKRFAAEAEEEAPEPARWPARAGAVAVLLAAIAAGGYFARDWIAPSEPSITLEVVSELDQQVMRLIDASAALRPPVSPEVVKAARGKRDTAGVLLQLARTASEAGDSDKAEVYLSESQSGLGEACALLVDGDLAARFAREDEVVRRAATGLGELKAKELAAADWQPLEQKLAAIAPPGGELPPCARGEQLLAGLGELDRSSAIAKEIEQKLEQKWPELATAARNEALHAQTALAQLEIDAPAFADALRAGREALASGDEAVKGQSFLKARDRYWDAKDSFEAALVVASAAGVQQELREVRVRAEQLEVRDAAIDAEIARADEHFQGGRFVEAKEAYRRALRFLKMSIDEAAQSENARKARELANQAREGAIAVGAERSASTELDAAGATYRKATEAFEAKGFADAERRYGEAAKQFGAARARAVVAMDRARKLGQETRAAAGELAKSCAKLTGDAEAACKSAQQALADADAAAASGDVSQAEAQYSRAGDAFAEARAIDLAQKENQPKAPVVTARVPAADQVSAAKGDAVRFSVKARDDNKGDTLRYTWTVDGATRPETGPELTLEPTANAQVAVTVDDGTGTPSPRATWQVAIKNRNPKLVLAPADATLRIEPGKSVSFSAQASDPDEEEVNVAFFVGNAKVGEGSSYEFRGAKEGKFVVEARATDASGGVTSARRTVEVRSDNLPPKLVLQPAGGLAVEEGQVVAFEASAQDPEEQPVVFAYFVDNKKASDGPRFTYTASSPGKHVVEVRATDAEGATSAARRTIQVAKAEPVVPKQPEQPPEQPARVPVPQPQPEQVAKQKPPAPPIEEQEPTSPPPPAEGAEKQIQSTMSLYKQYFKARDLARLNGVWQMNMMDKMDLQALFQACAAGKLDVALQLGKPSLVGKQANQAELRFTQVVKCNGGVVRNETRIAKLILRGADEWQIRTMQTQ